MMKKEHVQNWRKLYIDAPKTGGVKFDINIWYTGEELCEYLRQNNTLDLLFLDIELISTDGIKVGNFIREEMENMETDIIYISSNSSYAMNLFRIQPIDFLIKPLTEERTLLERQADSYANQLNIKSFDFNIIIGNLLENAILAASHSEKNAYL